MLQRNRLAVLVLLVGLGAAPLSGGRAQGQETPVDVLAAHVRTQGFPCQKPDAASQDVSASKPDEAVWLLRCDGLSYRIRLVPNQAAKVERVAG